MFAAPSPCANATYYDIGLGVWQGTFDFTVTEWKQLWSSDIGIKNKFLVVAMFLVTRVLGKGRIWSRLTQLPDLDGASVVGNEVRITKFGITLYVLNERYLLHGDCRQVTVQSRERFGPVPFLFNVSKEHPAEILDHGRRAIYYIPLLGADWIGDYRVSDNRNQIRSVLSCQWGEAVEAIERVT